MDKTTAINISQLIEKIDEIQHAGFVSYEPIQFGTINQNYIIHCLSKKFFLRINTPDVAGIQRENELKILEKIKNLDISPNIISSNTDYLLSEYEPQDCWSAEDCQRNHKILIKTISQYHEIELDDNFPDFKQRLTQYYDKSKHLLTSSFMYQYRNTVNKLNDLSFFDAINLIHYDLNRYNLLGKKPLKVIDWEFAGKGHPVFDIAMFMDYNNLPINQSSVLLQYCKEFQNGEEILNLSIQLTWQMNFMWEKIQVL